MLAGWMGGRQIEQTAQFYGDMAAKGEKPFNRSGFLFL
jgi:hypothetical protein